MHRVRPVEEDVDGGGERHRPQRDEEQVQRAERELQDGAHRNQSAHVHEDVQKLDAHIYTFYKYADIDTTIVNTRRYMHSHITNYMHHKMINFVKHRTPP